MITWQILNTYIFSQNVQKNTNAASDSGVEIASSLKYLSNSLGNFEMSLSNCEVILVLTWSSNCVIENSTGAARFGITDTKLYAPVIEIFFNCYLAA